jgi:uncharacterized protein (TIGR02118 family)
MSQLLKGGLESDAAKGAALRGRAKAEQNLPEWQTAIEVLIDTAEAETRSRAICVSEEIGMKVIYCLRRLPTLSRQEFLRHWFDVHAPLVRAYQRDLRISRYIQVHTDDGSFQEKLRAFRGSPEPYDGVAEIWYESREALETLGRDPAGRSASRLLYEDEQRFVDSSRSPIWIGEEHTII